MNLSRRKFVTVGSGAVLAASAGCDGVPKSVLNLHPPSRPDAAGPFPPPSSASVDAVSHVLNRLTFGTRPGDDARVRSLGKTPDEAARAFIEEQLAPEKIEDRYTSHHVRRYDALEEPAAEMFEFKERRLLDWMERATIFRAVHSERQLFEVMVQFWSDHFNIDPSKGDCRWLKAADDRDVIRKHALGSFPELLRASALSPAMLWYLDGAVNRKARPEDKPNENYGRELLELHTLGVHGGYTQRDVMEVARCLTGWAVRGKKQLKKGAVEFHPYLHDSGAKTVLGQVIPAIPDKVPLEEKKRLGEAELARVLDIVALHASTAKHLAEKLCRRFIADEPPAAAMAKVADAFLATKGDIRATLRALFATEDFLAARGNKFKRPFHYIVSALRATNATVGEKHRLVDYLLRMGHAPFHYPTPDGFPEEAGHWMGTLLWRWNFGVQLVDGRVDSVRLNREELEKTFGGAAGLMAHLLGRQPTDEEARSYHDSGAGLALMLASPGFQLC